MSASKLARLFALAIIAGSFLSVAFAGADDDTAAERQKMKELGLKYDSAWALYTALKEQAHGGTPLTWQTVPNWSGVRTRAKGITEYDPDGPPQGEFPSTAKWTPEYYAKTMKAVEDRKKGIEYDPLSQCIPPGYPRWLDMPFLREFIVTPEMTTMIAEAFNSIRFIFFKSIPFSFACFSKTSNRCSRCAPVPISTPLYNKSNDLVVEGFPSGRI